MAIRTLKPSKCRGLARRALSSLEQCFLDQARELQRKVEKALGVIAALKKENATLRSSLSGYEGRIRELEVLIEGFRKDQSLIEQCIHRALEGLDKIEDAGERGIATAPLNDRPVDQAETGLEDDEPETPLSAAAPKPAGPELDIF